MKQRHYLINYTATTKIQHSSDETMETTKLFRKNKIVDNDGKIIDKYNVSANAMRNRLRVAAATQLLELLNLIKQELPALAHIVLFSGGPRINKTSAESKKGNIAEGCTPIAYSNKICELFPFLELLGTTTAFSFVPVGESRLRVGELTAITKSILNCGDYKNIYKGTESPDICVEFQFNVKLDSKETNVNTFANMFDVQYIIEGTRFVQSITLLCDESKSNLLDSCFQNIFQYWQISMCGYVGGKVSNDCGRIKCTDITTEFDDLDTYKQYVLNNSQKIIDVLMKENTWKDIDAVIKKEKANAKT